MTQQANDFVINIIERTAEIMNHTFKRLIIEGINREVTTRKVLLNIAPNIISQDHAILIGIGIAGGWTTESSYFNELTSRIHMSQLKAATDNTAALTKDVFYLMWFGISDSIKVFRT